MSRRVLVIGEYGIRNGGENSLLAVIESLITKGWKFQAAVPKPSPFCDALRNAGVATCGFSLHAANGTRKSQEQIRVELAGLLRQKRPDLIHCNSLSTSRLVGPVARQLQIPAIGYLRDILKLSRKAISDINQLDRLVAVSQATRQFHLGQGISANKTIVIHNGVDSNAYHPATDLSLDLPQHEFGISHDAPKLLFVGQIGMRKGIDDLLTCFFQVTNHFPDAHLLIVGQRNSQKQEAIDYEQRLYDRTNVSKVASLVHWLGRRNDVAKLMRGSTLLVHPARQEPLGRVLLEAAASGLPIVTTNVGGSAEILNTDELQKLLVEPGDIASMTRVVCRLLSDVSERVTIGQILRSQATNRFSIDQCCQHLDREYRQLVQR